MRRRMRLFAAASAALLLVLAGCTKDNAPPTPEPDSGAVGWHDCYQRVRDADIRLPGMTVECGAVTVPRDWDHPDNGETFDIAVMRIYTGRLSDKQGSILANPGGPGDSGLDFLPSLVAPNPGPGVPGLMDKFAMVTFDPRGVGDSAAIDCYSDADIDEMIAFEPDPVNQHEFDDVVAFARRLSQQCGDKYGADLGVFNTTQTAKDVDAIRAALGDEKLTYLGFSYGTLLGAVYAQLFPQHIRAMVLDGAVDATASSIESNERQAMGFERALDNFSTWCKQHTNDCPISADPKGAIAEQLAKTAANPVRGAGGRDATAGWVFTAVLLSMYTQDAWPYLGPAIDDLSRGDPSLVFYLADIYVQRDDDGHYTNIWEANAAINCADGEYPSLDEIRDLQAQWRVKYPIFGASSATGMITCSIWPADKHPYPAGPATGAPKIVVVGTTGDPATPYESTQKLADMLGSDVGVVVTNEGEGHTAYPGSSCINNAVEHYLVDLEVPDDGLRCS